MAYWLFKTEPSECSIDDFANAPDTAVVWEGVRNYQARNMLRDQVRQDDLVFIYHSSCKLIGVAGIARIVREAYADPSQFDAASAYFDEKSSKQLPRWVAVDLVFVKKLPAIVTLDKLKSSAKLNELPLVQRGSRLSVMPVTPEQWQTILQLS
ncbi:MAG: EVE domain-containing protein [Gammaproteobacteria bacterium]|nr:EVE domain-containing protein [Gammaproteobacteria bacterium]MBU1556651.1 EVE domain-containing protein [Gammaproteobacteria bacterium]MBU2069393.1 EVE domain-containing protein [Gammaproteobacteria bacterium]MBU2182898.1 EVE domain-containing protein [Gammaproteobacteria bacterium]MBU2203499.1 EVE domain-containing protein [Gammaproteobacteria bacterium]